MAYEGLAQLQNCGGAEREVVGEKKVAAIGDVLGVVQIPHVAKGIEGSGEETIEGESAEDALLLALDPIHANIESMGVGRIQAGQIEVFPCSGGIGVAGAGMTV